ncbi:MAG: DUF998 domain-containing protein [Armatimonadetes bacterium]|nr:DUF998 domain-containing protein [Armatimonadota bacterium]
MHTHNEQPDERSLVFSYLSLRKTIGILGTALPFLVSLGALLVFQTGLQSSISSYYHTGMRDVFVGTLCAIGLFLLSYKGYERADDIAGDIACVSAIGVALFPTAPDFAASGQELITGGFHSFFATLFFLTLTYFSLFLFTKTGPKREPSRRKLQRNRVYRACGSIMLICVLLAGMYYLLPHEAASVLARYHPVYWLEAIAIVSFGISWLTKGEAILKDEVKPHGHP